MTIQFYKNSVSSANLIDESVFVEIHRQSLLFDNQFKLGSTRCVSFTLKVMKGGIGSFDKIIVRENNLTNKHVLYLDSVDTSEDLFDTYVLCDSMLKFNKAYDGSTLTNNGQTSVTYLQILQDICSQAGVTCGVSSFNGSSKTTTAYDTTTPGRDYISWFSEMHGGFAYIDSSDRLQFNRFSTTVSATIDANECSSIKIGDLHTIQRVVYDNYDMHFESGTVSGGETLYLNTNNRMITEQADVTAVYNVIKNFSFYNIKIEKCPILITLMPGQRIALSLNGVDYNTIAQIDHDYNLGWQGGFDCWLDNSEQVETQVIGEAQKRRIMEVKYDAELNEFSRTLTDIADDVSANTTAISQNASAITAVASRTTANETAISNLQVTADGISADVSNLTETVDGTVSSITYKYAKGTSETSQPADSAFTYDSMPAVEDGKWIWRKTVITYVSGQTSTRYEMIQGLDGQPGTPGAPGADGKDGQDGTSVTITSTSVDYAASSSGTSHPTSGWQSSVPSVSTGQYLWTRTVVNYSDGKSTTSYSVGYKGTNGTNGTDGTSVTVSSIQYASSTSGTSAPSSGWQSTIPSVAQGSFLWTKTTYSDGTVAYTASRQGQNGTSVTITSKAVEYQASSSGTTIPTGTWQTSVPSVSTGQYLWTRTTVNYSDGNSTVSYSVGYKGTNGTNGTNGTSVTINSKEIAYVKSNQGASAPSSGWSTTFPTNLTNGDYLWTRTTVNYSSGGSTVSYSVSYIGTNGTDGRGISSIAYYYAATTTQTQPAASAITSTTIPVLSPTNKYLWQKEVITYTSGNPTTNITLIGVYGDTGVGVQSMYPLYYMADGALDIELDGNTKQTGKNLVDIHNIGSLNYNTASYTSTGGLKLTIGTAGTYRYSSIKLSTGLLGKTITCSTTISVSGTAEARVQFYWLTAGGSTVSGGAIGNAITGTGSKTVTLTIPSTLASGAACPGILFYTAVATSGEAGASVTYDKVQLELGSSATAYEPYFGTIPSPDYPVPVHSVSGDNTITVCGKNIAQLNPQTKVVNGVTITVGSDGLITAKGTGTAGGGRLNYFSNAIPLKTGTYKFKKFMVSGTSVVSPLLTNFSTGTLVGSGATSSGSTIIPSADVDVKIGFNVANGTVFDESFYLQLELGSTATEYESYTAQEYPITLPVENMLYLPSNPYERYGITYTETPAGLQIEGTATTNHSVILLPPETILPVGTYTISGLDSSSSSTTYQLAVYKNNTALTYIRGSTTTYTFTANGIDQYGVRLYVYTTAGALDKVLPLMMSKGSKVNTYQPYINEFNPSTITQNYLLTWANASLSPETGSWVSDYIPVTNQEYVANKEITQLFCYDANKTANYVYDESGAWHAVGVGGGSTRIFTPPADAAYIRIGRRKHQIGDLTIAQDVASFKLVPRTKMAIELNKIGDYADYFHNDGGTWYVHKMISEYTITASSGAYSSVGTGYYGGYYNMSSLMPNLRTLGYCKELPPIASPTQATQEGITFGAGTNNKTVYFVLNASRLTESSKAGIDAWLSANPLHITYVLQTPTEVEITDTTLLGQLNAISQAMSYNGTTNILQDNNDLPFNIIYNEQAGVAPNPPTAEVTTATDAPDVWTINKPTFIDGYRYYNCLQIKMTDNAVSWTDVLPDTEFMALDGKIIEITRVQSQTDAHISELDDSINSIVKRTDTIEQSYVTANGLEDRLSFVKSEYETKIDQTAENINLSISEVQSTLDGVKSNLTTYFNFSNNGLIIGRSSSEIKQQFTNDATQFIDSSGTVYGKISASDGVFGAKLALGNPDVRTQRWYITVGGSDSERLDIDRYSND